MTSIGIVGQGFVGGALREGMRHCCEIFTYDKYKSDLSNAKSIEHLCSLAEIIFVCVPTPMFKSTGQCDTSIVEEVVGEVASAYAATKRANGKPSIVIKSTIPPGSTKMLQSRHMNVHIVFQPEFLTEANAVFDFKNQNRIVIGAESGLARAQAKTLFKKAFPNVPILETSSTAAEMVKYVTNGFLATKVSFANEMYQICKGLDIEWSRVIQIASLDLRLGTSHWRVPGPMPDPSGELKPGFSGSCFVKDLNALMFVSEELGVDAKILKAAWDKNLEVRPEKDWEQLIGRAVSKEKDG